MSNETTEMWREFRQQDKERRHARQQTAADKIGELSGKYGFLYVPIQPHQIRILGGTGGKEMDIYPQRSKYSIVGTGKFNHYKNLEGLIKQFFNIK